MRYLFFIFLPLFLTANAISNYKAILECVQFNNNEYIALRSFNFSNRAALLIVEPNSLQTAVVLVNSTKKSNCSTIMQSRYVKLLMGQFSLKHPLQNDGIVSSGSGVIVTTDLCPSSKSGFEKRLYSALIKEFKNPVPVTLFITKRWIIKHPKAFAQLQQWNKEGKLAITWGNHTAEHIYHPKLPLNKNFVLSKEEQLQKDILDLEVVLLNRGVLPSVFFRFPGLVSDKNATQRVQALGLITIGTNSWLAKGQSVRQDSIILLHGNKNEPKGVDIFLKLLQSGQIKSVNSILNLKAPYTK